MQIIRVFGISVCIAALVELSLAQAQALATGIAGTVRDTSGAVFPGASVSTTSASGKTQTAVTNEQGEYSFSGLPADVYSLAISAAGFKSFQRDGITLSEGQILSVDATLEPAEAATSVKVTGSKVAQVETESAQVSGTITKTEVVSLGLNGRNFTQLIALGLTQKQLIS